MHPSTLLLALTSLTLSTAVAAAKHSSATPTTTWTITGLNPAQLSALNAYESSLTHDTKAVSSISSILATATATEKNFDAYNTQAQSVLQAAVTATKSLDLPDIPKDLPKDVKSYLSSVYKHEISILTKQLSNTQTGTNKAVQAQATGYLMQAGVAAAGVLGVAALL